MKSDIEKVCKPIRQFASDYNRFYQTITLFVLYLFAMLKYLTIHYTIVLYRGFLVLIVCTLTIICKYFNIFKLVNVKCYRVNVNNKSLYLA